MMTHATKLLKAVLDNPGMVDAAKEIAQLPPDKDGRRKVWVEATLTEGGQRFLIMLQVKDAKDTVGI